MGFDVLDDDYYSSPAEGPRDEDIPVDLDEPDDKPEPEDEIPTNTEISEQLFDPGDDGYEYDDDHDSNED